jgi:hypothetical protein
MIPLGSLTTIASGASRTTAWASQSLCMPPLPSAVAACVGARVVVARVVVARVVIGKPRYRQLAPSY